MVVARRADRAIISIAQQASPKVIGNIEFEAAQASTLSSLVVSTACSTCSSMLGVVEVAAQQVASAQLADPQVLGRPRLGERREAAQLLALYLQSRAPLRQT